MKSKFIAVFGLMFGMIFLFGCNKNIPQNARQTLFIEFVNSAGENLIEKNNIDIVSTSHGVVVDHFLNEIEYFLTLKINGTVFTPDIPLRYSDSDWSEGFLEFGCWDNNYNLRNERDPYTYEFDFVCPKLFGDDQPRKISVVWGTKKKTVYNRILEIRFNGELIKHEDQRDPKVTIVLE